jgi:hypothetical protein
VAVVFALAAVGIYLKIFLPPVEERDGATIFALALWSLTIFGVVLSALGGDLGPLADIAAWSKGTD